MVCAYHQSAPCSFHIRNRLGIVPPLDLIRRFRLLAILTVETSIPASRHNVGTVPRIDSVRRQIRRTYR